MAQLGRDRRRTASALAELHGGVVSRALLRDAGVDRWAVAAEVRADRWALHGLRTVAVHTADLSREALRWRAVWEVGRSAALDGVSALEAAGLAGYDEDTIHVSVDHQGHGAAE